MIDTAKIIIIVLLVLLILGGIYFIFPSVVPQNNNIQQNKYDIPLKNSYQPLLVAPDNRYVYFPDEHVYLLPYEYLNFNNPYDRWMYYNYNRYYSYYYPRYYPFSDNYYGRIVYDGHVNRGRGHGNRVVHHGSKDYSGRGITPIIAPTQPIRTPHPTVSSRPSNSPRPTGPIRRGTNRFNRRH